MTAPEIRKKMKDRKLTVISESLSIPYGKLRRWFLGNESALSIDELRKLLNYMKAS